LPGLLPEKFNISARKRAGRSARMGAVGAILFNALVWGISWWPMRQLQEHGLHPLWTTALIYLLITLGLLAFRASAWRGVLAHRGLWLLALFTGLTNVGFNWAVTVGDVVRVVLLFYLMPAWSVLVAWALLGEKPSRGSLLRLALAMSGVLIVLKTPDSPWPLPQGPEDWLAILGGFSFAVTNVLLRRSAAVASSARMLAMFGGSGLMAGAVALAGMGAQIVPAPALAWAGLPVLLGLGLALVASNAALQYGAVRLAASTTAIVMLTEILFASASAALLGGAQFSLRTVLGGSLIVLAAVLAALVPPKR
jgi:drug/metabolite transporter (DMT)-like permease